MCAAWLIEGVVDRGVRDGARCGVRQRHRDGAPGGAGLLVKGPRAPGPPPPSIHLGPGSSACKASRSQGWPREPRKLPGASRRSTPSWGNGKTGKTHPASLTIRAMALVRRGCLERTGMTFDTIIRGGTVATASDTFACDVGIRGGRIAALGDDLGDGRRDRRRDAASWCCPAASTATCISSQPSGPGIVMADDFASGTRVGGVRRQHHGAAVRHAAEGRERCARW